MKHPNYPYLHGKIRLPLHPFELSIAREHSSSILNTVYGILLSTSCTSFILEVRLDNGNLPVFKIYAKNEKGIFF
jgi:hypothetical protein